MFRRPKVLLLTSDGEEARNLKNALDEFVLLVRVETISELKSSLAEADFDVVLCAWAIYRSEWEGSLNEVRECYPDLPVIILSKDAEGREWAEAIEAGAFDLLTLVSPKPLALALVEQAADSHEARKALKMLGAQSAAPCC